MKFAFMLVTRSNPLRASAVIECAKSLASGKHEIKYIVGCDADDKNTIENFPGNQSLAFSIGPRPFGVGAVWNRCIEAVGPADIYCPFPDDVFIGLPDWDDHIAHLMQHETLISWNDLTNPMQCTLPIAARAWLKLIDGKFYDERFPFWFYDTCVDELFSFVNGRSVIIPKPLTLIAKKGLTQNMREVGFWWDFYVATRTERIAKAADIRKHCGIELEPKQLADTIAAWEARDIWGRASAIKLEQTLSAEGHRTPSPQYLQAKANAEAYLAQRKVA